MSKIFKAIYRVVDKCIVTPISRFIYFFNKKFSRGRGGFDKLLNMKSFLLYLSLFFAVVTFLVIDNKAISLVETQYDVIPNVPVVVKYNSVAYVIEGVPETVDITITGRKGDIYLAKQLGDHQVELDLTNYQASDTPYKVEYKYTKSVDNLSYKLSPSYANVLIKKKVSEVVPLSYDLLNVNSLNPELNVKEVDLGKSEVTIKGSVDALKSVSVVKALIDLEKQSLTKTGSYDINNVKLVAYDNNGKIMKNIEIVPSTITPTIVLDSYYKTLPIQVSTTGKLVPGKAISTIQINKSGSYSVKVYGDKESLDKLDFIPVTIDIDELGNNSAKTYNVSLSKPAGVRYIDNDIVTIAVTFADEDQRTIDIGNKIVDRNTAEGLSANIISTDIKIQVKGVSSVIKDITADDILAYADLKGLKKGVHNVSVKIDNNNPLVSYSVSGTIKVEIS